VWKHRPSHWPDGVPAAASRHIHDASAYSNSFPPIFGWEPYSRFRTSQPHLSLLSLPGLYDSTPNIPWTRFTFKRSLTPRLKSVACAYANLGQRSDSSSPTGSRYRYIEGLRAKKSQSSSKSRIRLAAARMGLVVVFIESIEVARNLQLSDSEELFRVSGEHPEQGSYD